MGHYDPIEPQRLTKDELQTALTVVEVRPGMKVGLGVLRSSITDLAEFAHFAAIFKLSEHEARELYTTVFPGTRGGFSWAALVSDVAHSTTLQSYIVETAPQDVVEMYGELSEKKKRKIPTPSQDTLARLQGIEQLTVAPSIAEVALKLHGAIEHLPVTQASMTLAAMLKFNTQYNTVGTYGAKIVRPNRVHPNLVVLDDSGSMSEQTIKAIIDEVVALGHHANAHLVLVSNTARHWTPGTYNSKSVLREAQYSGTHYESLSPLFLNQQWDTVITIADYDSSWSACEYLLRESGSTSIRELIDISLVSKPSFLAECLGQFAQSAKPMVIAERDNTGTYYR